MKTNKVEIGKIKMEVPENATVFCVAVDGDESGLYLNGSSLRLKSLAFTGIARMYTQKGTDGYFTAAELAAGLELISDAIGPDYKLSVSYKGEELVGDKSKEQEKRAKLLADMLMEALEAKRKMEDDDDDD